MNHFGFFIAKASFELVLIFGAVYLGIAAASRNKFLKKDWA